MQLAPGQRHAFRLGDPFGTTLSPGRYRVRYAHPLSRRGQAPPEDWVGLLQSAWVDLEVQ